MGNSPYSTLVLIALMVVAFYFLIIRPNKKRQQTQQQTMSSLTPGTRVLLTSGVFGTIVEIGDKQAVLEVSPGNQLTVLKQAIARVTRPGEEDTDRDSDDDDVDDDDLTSVPTYDAPVGTAPSTYETSAPGSTSVGGSSAVGWSAGTDQPGTQPGSDQDPRSGTSTTPIRD